MFHVERFSTLSGRALEGRFYPSMLPLYPSHDPGCPPSHPNHRESLSREQARAVMSQILAGDCQRNTKIAALLVALHMKGETVEEIVGFAEAIRAATPLTIPQNSTLDVSGTGRDALVDTCGTGGDASGTFNISTATAFVCRWRRRTRRQARATAA